MWTSFSVVLALALAAPQAPGQVTSASAGEAPGVADAGPPPSGAWCREAGRNLRTLDPTAHARLAELVRASTTAREMVAFVCAAREIHFTLGGRRGLRRERGYGGLSAFALVDGVLIGRLEFDISETTRDAQRVTVAHELAHAVELAALPRVDTPALARLPRAGHGRHPAWSPQQTIETPFAVAVERQVAAELRVPSTPDHGRLEAIARAHGLAPTPIASGDQR
jgi:hypothetical protein